MEYVALKDLNINKNEAADKVINYHGVEIVVKQHLGILEKIDIISRVCQDTLSLNAEYYNTIEMEGFFYLRVILGYTNIVVSEEEGSSLGELYDLLKDSDFNDIVWKSIPQEEIDYLKNEVRLTLANLYSYKNSIYGIMENLSTDYSNLQFDIDSLKKDLADNEDLSLIKKVADKLG